MKPQDYNTTISVNATPKEAFEKMAKVDKWWAKNFTGKAEKLHDKFTVNFGNSFIDLQIIELVPNKKVAWKVTDCYMEWIKAKKEWKGTEVVFEFSGKENTTQIDFTHIGLLPNLESYKNGETGWNSHIAGNLLKFINEGEGTPF